MTAVTVLFILALIFGFYVAWNIGANDVANAVGTSVGSGALTLKNAVIIAAIFEFCGAFLLGSNVSETIEAGVVKPALFSGDSTDYVFGMLASLLAAGIWLQIASYFGLPVSTTHSIVGAVLGFGLVFGGIHAIYWGTIGTITLSWILSPILGGGLSYVIFGLIRKRILYTSNPVVAAKRLAPLLVLAVFFTLSLIILFDGLKALHLDLNILQSFGIALGVGCAAAFLTFILVRRIQENHDAMGGPNLQMVVALAKTKKHLSKLEAASMGKTHEKVERLLDEVKDLEKDVGSEEWHLRHSAFQDVEKIFIYLQIITACFMAFAHGSNDVANAIGPLSAIVNVLHGKPILNTLSVPLWLLLLGGAGIVVGLATWGWRVIETVGKKITELTPSRGFAAGFASALTIVLASKLGLPISTTHVLVGAVLGVGLARGIGAINLNTIRDIVISWVVTVPAGAILSALFFVAFRYLFSR